MYCTEKVVGDFKDIEHHQHNIQWRADCLSGIGGNISNSARPPIMLCNSNYRWQPKDFLNRDDPDNDAAPRPGAEL